MQELFLYSSIYSWTAQDLIQQLNDTNGEEVILRVNSGGGEVFANYGICAKMAEHGNVICKVDGTAMSSAANLLFYAKRVECLDETVFLFHRADMYCRTDEDKEFLAKVNKGLKQKMLMKIDADKFKEVTGVSIDEMFDPEQRRDVVINAKEAKQIGLVDKIVKLTPSETARIEAFTKKSYFKVAADASPNNSNPLNMTTEKLKAEHPAVYQQIFENGVTAGIAKEKDRVGAFMAFVELDPKAVKEGITKGESMTETQRSEFALKAISKTRLESIEGDGTDKPLATSERGEQGKEKEKTEKEKEVAAFSAAVDARLGIKK